MILLLFRQRHVFCFFGARDQAHNDVNSAERRPHSTMNKSILYFDQPAYSTVPTYLGMFVTRLGFKV